MAQRDTLTRALFGFAVFISAWCFVASRLRTSGARGPRRHIFGFLAATIALVFSAAVGFPHTKAPGPEVEQVAEDPQIVERPAATAASVTEWAEIQGIANR